MDDPNVSSPPGLGSNVFKDRGALERSDFIGPCTPYNPVDNDPPVRDRNQTVNKVLLVSRLLSNFSIQLIDNVSASTTSQLPAANLHPAHGRRRHQDA